VYSAVRAHLSDDEIAAGQVFTDAKIQPFYKAAYSVLFRAMQNWQNPRVRREWFYNLPANTSVLAPATAGISNMGEIESIEERGIDSSFSVVNAVPGSGLLTITSDPHSFSTGDQVVVTGVGGISDDINGIWTITVSNGTTFTLNGCTATGTYTSGGVASKSAEEFSELDQKDRIESVEAPSDELGEFAWMGDVIRFRPCSKQRQLRIVFTLSGNAPTSTTASVGIDDSLDFLAAYTAYLAALAKGKRTTAMAMKELSIGYPQDGGYGGLLGQFLEAGVLALQNQQWVRPPFRDPRSNIPKII
jgi:hypothetical protein